MEWWVMCGPKTTLGRPHFLTCLFYPKKGFLFAKWLRSWPGPPLLYPAFPTSSPGFGQAPVLQRGKRRFTVHSWY